MLSIGLDEVKALTDTGKITREKFAEGLLKIPENEIAPYSEKMDFEADSVSAGFRILIVDDDSAFCGMLARLLESTPYDFEIDIAQNGFQAGYTARQNPPGLILLDVMMAGVNGIDVVEALKELSDTRHIRIIGMTGAATKSRITRMVTAGAETVLQKPFGIDDLVKAIGENELKPYLRSGKP